MTRGTIILILPDFAISSIEFNGDMYEGGNYEEVIERLKRVNSIGDFKKEIRQFNIDNFGYKEKPYYFVDYNEDWCLDNGNLCFDFEIPKETDEFVVDYWKEFFSDYIFIKNLSGRNISLVKRECLEAVEETVLFNNEITTFNFGSYLKSYKSDDVKKKDVKVELQTPKSKAK